MELQRNNDFKQLLMNLPTVLFDHIKSYTLFVPKTKEELEEAINIWCKHRIFIEVSYCHIGLWDTVNITDMSNLFFAKHNFNDNINYWNVSNFYGWSN